jgi:hypothetical protein
LRKLPTEALAKVGKHVIAQLQLAGHFSLSFFELRVAGHSKMPAPEDE